MRKIDGDALLDAVQWHCTEVCRGARRGDCDDCKALDIIAMIEDAPEIEESEG